MLVRVTTATLLATGLSLCCVAGFNYLGQPDAPGVTIEEPDRELKFPSPVSESLVTFQIENRSSHAARVVGLYRC
jgi:hypothetical protein